MSNNTQNPNSFTELVNRYGAYAVGFLAALGALVGALLMPAHATMLVSAAGTLAIVNFFFTNQYDSFRLRLMGLFVAGVALVFAILLPAQAPQLLSASGTIAGLSLVFG